MSAGNFAMYSSDSDMLIVPQLGTLKVTTEFGLLQIKPKEIIVIPRGVKFAIDPSEADQLNRGWIAEVFKGHF